MLHILIGIISYFPLLVWEMNREKIHCLTNPFGEALMGTIIGAVADVVLFSIFGFLPAFRFGSSLALYMLYKIAGRSVEPVIGAVASLFIYGFVAKRIS